VTVDPQLGDRASGEVLVDGDVIKGGGTLEGVDAARVRRLAIEARDEIVHAAAGEATARIGVDRVPEAHVGTAA
jgi:hypothetical protein